MTKKNIDAVYENVSQDVKDLVELGFYSKEEVCGVKCEPWKPYTKGYVSLDKSKIETFWTYDKVKNLFLNAAGKSASIAATLIVLIITVLTVVIYVTYCSNSVLLLIFMVWIFSYVLIKVFWIMFDLE